MNRREFGFTAALASIGSWFGLRRVGPVVDVPEATSQTFGEEWIGIYKGQWDACCHYEIGDVAYSHESGELFVLTDDGWEAITKEE